MILLTYCGVYDLLSPTYSRSRAISGPRHHSWSGWDAPKISISSVKSRDGADHSTSASNIQWFLHESISRKRRTAGM